MEIVKADSSHIAAVARLFDLYRQFYECEPDLTLATNYIRQRIENGESTIFVAMAGDAMRGFVQLYPSFCSVQAVKIQVLYDLYVDREIRSSGVGRMLMDKATEFSRASGASRIDLQTGFDNLAGQHLYEKLGYVRVNEQFHSYSLELS